MRKPSSGLRPPRIKSGAGSSPASGRRKIIVTRPEPFAAPLCEAINNNGFNAIHLPTLAFEQLPIAANEIKLADTTIDWMIFISPQAVLAYQHALSQQEIPRYITQAYVAIGAGTAHALKSILNIDVTITPPNDIWNSESILALPQFQQIRDKKIIIVRGVGGRELIDHTLASRGATIIPFILYKRVLPKINMQSYIDLLRNKMLDCIICTSFESVNHLKILFGDDNFSLLSKIPLIVISERIKKLAADLNFQTIWVARNPSVHAIMATLKAVQSQRRNDNQ